MHYHSQSFVCLFTHKVICVRCFLNHLSQNQINMWIKVFCWQLLEYYLNSHAGVLCYLGTQVISLFYDVFNALADFDALAVCKERLVELSNPFCYIQGIKYLLPVV